MDYEGFDWHHPRYAGVVQQRLAVLDEIRSRPGHYLPALRAHYKQNPADFINDWGITYDPRNADIGLPTYLPFILFPKQREFVEYIMRKWKAREPGLVEKSRDVGATWLAASLACTLCLFYEGMAVGFGSRVVDLVDKIGTMKPILPKARIFMANLPPEFRPGWDPAVHAPYMRIVFPETGSFIGGEGGDQIGRGDRTSIYFVDEAAHIERPDLVEASLSETTRCRIDMSSVNTMNNPFARKRWEGRVEPFIFDWRDDPRKDEEWYEKRCRELDPVVVAQEIDRDYSAAVHGIVVPGAWVRAAIDACDKLGITPTGRRSASLDVADEGRDKNAIIGRTGIQIDHIEEWSGKGGDIYSTTQHAFGQCDLLGIKRMRYDADGLGAGVRGDARIINEEREHQARHLRVEFEAFRGSGEVSDPDGLVDPDSRANDPQARTNKDFFANRKAQGWWSLRRRFERTFRWVTQGVQCSPDDIISISSKAPGYLKLVAELSQPTYKTNGVGKIVVDKSPDGTKSPNLGDACMIDWCPSGAEPMVIPTGLVAAIRAQRPSMRHMR